MRATIQDAEALAAVTPANLVSYLRARGWVLFNEDAGKYSVWHLPTNAESEVLVSARNDTRDFVTRLSETLKELEVAENRSQIDILKDISSSGFDLIRIRAMTTNANSGTIPMDDGVLLFQQAQEALTASALATIDPRPYYQSRRPNQVNDYLKSVRLGQTEQGSYVLTLLSPVAPQLAPTADGNQTPEPFERKVVTTFGNSLKRSLEAADRALTHNDFAPFQTSVRDGVNANLCEAIASMVKSTLTPSVDIGITWSPNRPTLQLPRFQERITSGIVPILEEAARIFRSRESFPDYTLVGFVHKLDRPQNRRVGKVTIYGLVNDDMHKVALQMESPMYESAVRAHRDRRALRVNGLLVRDGRSYKLEHPTNLIISEIAE